MMGLSLGMFIMAIITIMTTSMMTVIITTMPTTAWATWTSMIRANHSRTFITRLAARVSCFPSWTGRSCGIACGTV